MITDLPYYAEALEWANQVRLSKGMEPLEALPEDDCDPDASRCDTCPLAKATGMIVFCSTYGGDGVEHELPEHVREFIYAVDRASGIC